ncbi:lipoprotein-releasing system ATP-binding protein [Limimonas halophila]|uniref:Lipoprotein-releasing system ATP-binding protein n=1 Tax=Limimonas halophila TaxID=1082479 RepID=A0A1G7N8E8_9PROT|nr:ABC transporter ATP-binding protein [Limimonas halophila]SDF70348.1 lipoprotein-releasing system ATP-binding protein [Limimonas halophila]
MSEPALHIDGVHKEFRQGENRLTVLDDAALTVQPGEFVALVGPSGSGKSTLMHIAGLLERPDTGRIRIAGADGSQLNDGARTRLRRTALGFVYQHHHLLPEFSAAENLILPQMIAGSGRREARSRALELLEQVGLSERADHRPARLSGGEAQRVAIARALVNRPDLLLADEPTGNLDPHTSDRVFDLLQGLARDAGLAALVATHNFDLAARMDRTLRIVDGHVSPA